MWHLVNDMDSIRLIGGVLRRPVAAVCHAPAVLTKVAHQGQPIVKGKRVTGFTNGEEEAVHLIKVVPFLVEDELKRLGGRDEKAADWADFTLADGGLIIGQNPTSSGLGCQGTGCTVEGLAVTDDLVGQQASRSRGSRGNRSRPR